MGQTFLSVVTLRVKENNKLIMPEISRFYGIVIRMHIDEHNPPHFHAKYSDKEVVVSITDPAIIYGTISPRALRLVLRWAKLNQGELLLNWENLRSGCPAMKIKPLE